MKRGILIAFVVLGLAVCGVPRVRLSYKGEPHETHHSATRVSEPKAVQVYRNGASGTMMALGATRDGDTYQIKVTIENPSPFSTRHLYVHELRDHRGALVRRHTFGPLDIEAGAERTFYDTLRVPRSERWYVDRETTTVKELKRWSQG